MDRSRVTLTAAADLCTSRGAFRIFVFRDGRTGSDGLAMVGGDVWGRENVAVRVHGERLGADATLGLHGDCRRRLEEALATSGAAPPGVVLFPRWDGTAERDDARDDDAFARAMLRTLGVRSVHLMTNDPGKLRELCALGLPTERVALVVGRRAEPARERSAS